MKTPFLTRIDPRVKGFALLLFSVLVLFSTRWNRLAALALVVIAAIPGSGARFPEFLLRLRKVLWFVLIIVVVNAVTLSGSVLVNAGKFSVTTDGILAGLFLSVRLVLLLWASSAFLWSTPVLDMLDGMGSSLRFVNLPAGPAVMTVSIALNFVPLLIQSAKRVRSAQLARGADEAPGLIAQIGNTSMLALPLFAAVFRSADNLADAMDSRCYSGSRPRSQYRVFTMQGADWGVLSGITLFALLFFRFA